MTAGLLGLALGLAAGAGLAAWRESRRRRLLGRYLAFGAHELNSPLTALTMTVSNALQGLFGELPAELRPWLEQGREQVSRLAALTAELRDFAHLELTGELEYRLEDVPVADLLRAASRAVQASFAQTGFELKVADPSGLGDARCDPETCERLLASLLYHARKLRLSGPIELSARGEGAFVAVSVRFQGPVLSAAETRRSLDLYYPGRVAGQALSTAGFGLGLACRLLERQGGALSLSVENGRHTLLARLPAARK